MVDIKELIDIMRKKGLKLASAESCTGGLIGKLMTDIPGASDVYLGGFVTYTNDVKINILGVSAETIKKHTEVSRETATEMADRARLLLCADVGVSTTGYAGPGGGTREDPVGTVYIGISAPHGTNVIRLCAGCDASRADVREAAADAALSEVLRFVKDQA